METKPKLNPEPKIIFSKLEYSRIYADGFDTLNWLKHINESVAVRFEDKMRGAEKRMNDEFEKRNEEWMAEKDKISKDLSFKPKDLEHNEMTNTIDIEKALEEKFDFPPFQKNSKLKGKEPSYPITTKAFVSYVGKRKLSDEIARDMLKRLVITLVVIVLAIYGFIRLIELLVNHLIK